MLEKLESLETEIDRSPARQKPLVTPTGSAQASRTLQQLHQELENRIEEQTRDLQREILERTRAEKNLQQQFARINLLHQITAAISDLQDLGNILQTVLRQLERNMAIDLGAVFLLNPDANSLSVSTVSCPSLYPSRLPIRERDSFAVGQTGLLDCLHGRTSYAKDTQVVPDHLFQLLAASGLKSAVAVPLTVAASPFGILLVARRAKDAFTSGECEFFRMLSNHVAVAAHQARLYEELRHAYDELKQSQQTILQQERLRALGEMASGIAHDINNALSPIVVYSDLILMTEPDLSESTRRHLASIKTAGDDIAHFVSRMRDFYRKRDVADAHAPLNCNELIEQVVDYTRPRWHDIPLQKGTVVSLATHFHSPLPAISANAAELREALTNLVLNALDAMPGGGTLTLATGVKTAPSRTASCIVIEVTDTGVGMDEATRARCLEPFFSTKGQRGTGLGLAMVYGIMERHGGRIEIDSAPGKGTTMRLIIPTADSAPSPIHSKEAVPGRPLHILYIDDEPMLRELLKEALELDGHTVSVADHGQAGLHLFRAAQRSARPFDAVITDLGMPYMDGRQVAAVLKNESPNTPVIMLTGWGAMMQADGDHPAHVDAVIAKPPHTEDLRATLQRLTSGVPF